MKILLLLMALLMGALNGPNIANGLSLVPGGDNVVFEIKPNGIIITGTYDVKIDKTIYNPSKHSDLNKGDIIIGCEGKTILEIQDFIECFNTYNNQDTLNLTIKRKNSTLKKELKLIHEGQSIKTGLYVKERLLGIGTVSFYDPVTKKYGALGHEVIDQDTNSVLDVRTGAIYEGEVIGVNKGTNGHPGDKVSEVNLNNNLGTLISNTPYGIFGEINQVPSTYQAIEVAKVDQVKLGEAKIYTVTKGNTIKQYDIQITNLAKQEDISTKGITFKITDQELLSLSGGVYSGMSGSPIIQGDYLVGAVTHVLVNDIEKGYGIYMEYMYQAMLLYS